MGVLQRIGRGLDQFARWLWSGRKPPERKKWCAVLYFVAVEEQGLNYPDTSLDPKMKEAIAALKKASIDFSDLHVAYRSIGADGRVAEALSWVPGNFMSLGKKDYEFTECQSRSDATFDTGNDMRCFFKWVFRWCPADHYAIFFWGHSFGPAGLFEKYGTLQVPESGAAFLREALEDFARSREAASPSTDKGASGRREIAAASAELEALSVLPQTTVDLVLFQNCWMGTLETAYELKGVANYAVASQSLVPIGRKFLDFVWPYRELFDALFKPDVGPAAMAALKKFYQQNWDEEKVKNLSCVPFALLDLSKVPGVTQPLKDLVRAIDAVHPATDSGLGHRASLFGRARIVPRGPGEEASDEALVDVRKLCDELKHVNPSIAAAALNLKAALAPLVTHEFEAGPSDVKALGFGGVSAFYRPPGSGTSIIAGAIARSNYEALQFSKQTQWPGLEQPI